MESKGIELARKLLALKNQGHGGEEENAAKMLDHIMKKYDLTLSEIEGLQVEAYEMTRPRS